MQKPVIGTWRNSTRSLWTEQKNMPLWISPESSRTYCSTQHVTLSLPTFRSLSLTVPHWVFFLSFPVRCSMPTEFLGSVAGHWGQRFPLTFKETLHQLSLIVCLTVCSLTGPQQSRLLLLLIPFPSLHVQELQLVWCVSLKIAFIVICKLLRSHILKQVVRLQSQYVSSISVYECVCCTCGWDTRHGMHSVTRDSDSSLKLASP